MKILLSTATVIVMAWLTACASPPAPTPTPALPAAANEAPLTLTLWHAQTGVAETTLQALLADFHTVYPSLTVRAETKSNEGDLLRQGIAGMAMNQVPDVLIASHRTTVEFANKDALVPLDAFLNDPALGLRDEERADFLPGLLDAGRFPGFKNQFMTLPFDEHAVVLYYNADALQAAKIKPPRTWDDFGQAVRVTTKSDTRGWVMSPDAAVFYALVFSRGGNVLNDTQTQVLFSETPGIQSLQLIAALTKGDAAYLAESPSRAIADFAQGKATFLFGTDDDLAGISDAMTKAQSNFQWSMTNVPQSDPSRAYTTVFGAHTAIFRTTPERQRAAWLLGRWLAAPEQTARWARATLAIPARTSAFTLLTSGASPNLFLQRLSDGFSAGMPTGRSVPSVRDAAQIDAAVVEMWIAVATGTDPGTAMSRAVARANRVLKP